MATANASRVRCYIFLAFIFVNVTLTACQTPAPIASDGTPQPAEVVTSKTPDDEITTGIIVQSVPAVESINREQIIEMGTGNFVGISSDQPAEIQAGTDDITLNFQDTDLREFIQAILGSILNENYMIDPNVTGRVSIQTSNPVPRSELFPLFENILDLNNAMIVHNNGVYQILPKSQSARGYLSPTTSASAREGYGIRIIPLQFLDALEMQKILEPIIAEGGNLRVDPKRNLVIITGTGEQIETVQETIDLFDVDWLRGMSVGLYPLNYVDPITLKAELDAVITGIAGASGDGLMGGIVRAVPLERLNSILLISSTVNALREVEIWLRRLDKPGDHPGQRLYVYNVQNAKAIELAEILTAIFRRGSSVDIPSPVRLAPGLSPAEISNRTNDRRPDATGGINISSGNSIEIIADDSRNALVILATQAEYQMVEAALTKLDIVPLQVLIEASIIEVTLDNNLNYGVEWFFKNRVDDPYKGIGRLDLGSAGISAVSPSFSYSIIRSAGDVRVALNTLAAESNIKVLSSPSLMVLDNKTATINIGDEIPVPTRQSTSNIDPASPTINEIQFRKTGVTLTVTPRVNQGGLVTMAIRQEVSSAVGTTSSNIDAPTIQQRQIESEVAINSGETIVLGGLIQDSNNNGNNGLPGFRNIPFLGNLFSQTTNENHRTELLVLITPRVVSNRNEAREITDEYRKKLQGLAPPT